MLLLSEHTQVLLHAVRCLWTGWRNRKLRSKRTRVRISAGPLQKPWASCSHACASVIKQYNLVPADGLCRSLAGKVSEGLAESNGSLPPGGWLKVTCGLTTCTLGLAAGLTLGNEYGRTLPLPLQCLIKRKCVASICAENSVRSILLFRYYTGL